MTNSPVFEMIDATIARLEQALRACGLPLSLSQNAFTYEGEGAWHEVYRVTVPQQADPFIVRIRKPVAYGQPQHYSELANEWHAEYVSTSLYYMQANRAQPDICPSMFLYHVSEEITCTVESHMGRRLDLSRLDHHSASTFGRQIGSMMRKMHQKKTHIPGAGELKWDGANLYGEQNRAQVALNRKIEQSYNENILSQLAEQHLNIDWHSIGRKLDAAHLLRDIDEPIVLINRDITTENLTVQPNHHIGIIDPYPYLGNGTRFAAWFIHCYRFLLPAYAHTKRYRHNHYDRYADILGSIANGFEKGYTQGDPELATHLAAEQWLWTLEQAYDDLERLTNDNRSEKTIMKHGSHDVVHQRFTKTLHILDKLTF